MLSLIRQRQSFLHRIRTMATANSDQPVEDAIRSKVRLFQVSLVLYTAARHYN